MEQASGSIGSITAENGRAGLTLKSKPRAKRKPNAKQREFTTRIKFIHKLWVEMQPIPKARWIAYAKANTKTNQVGNTTRQSGWNAFYGCASAFYNAKIFEPIIVYVGPVAPQKKGNALEVIFGLQGKLAYKSNFKDYPPFYVMLYTGKTTGDSINHYHGNYNFKAFSISTNEGASQIIDYLFKTIGKQWIKIVCYDPDGTQYETQYFNQTF